MLTPYSALRPCPLSALLWALLCFATPARAATLNVPTTTYPTIQAAVTAAQNGDTVLIADGTYSGPGNRDIDFGGKSLTVRSASGDPTRAIVDCAGSDSSNHRGFYLHSGEAHAAITGLTIENGYQTNSAPIAGGGADGGRGGGLLLQTVGATIQNCIISNNTSLDGGVYDHSDGSNAVLLANCTITGNTTVSGNGGGVYDDNGPGGTTRMTDCTVSGNAAVNGLGSGIYNNNYYGSAGTITLTRCTITGNKFGSLGGGVYNNSNSGVPAGEVGEIALIACAVSGNHAAGGGGVYDQGNGGGTIALTDCVIFANSAGDGGGTEGHGGGVYNFNFNTGGANLVTLTNCTFTGNQATTSGSGTYISSYFQDGGGPIILTNDILYGDTSTGTLRMRSRVRKDWQSPSVMSRAATLARVTSTPIPCSSAPTSCSSMALTFTSGPARPAPVQEP